eukprot:m.173546 g.173546  ORF g.173546 m.173546 type:complete len:84 (-) comp16532_c1_seq1:349-600(-)
MDRSPAQVGDWISSLGYPQYRYCFESNYINGEKLKYIDASRLPRLGITDFTHIKSIAKSIRDLYGLAVPNAKQSIAEVPFTTH